jgi:hypothetical protein
LIAAFGIVLLVAGAGGIVEVSEANLPVSFDSFMDAVCILYHAVVHAPHTVSNIGMAIQAVHGVPACQNFDFACDFLGFLLGDELGGLNAVNHEAQFIGFKGRVQQPITFFMDIVFQLQAKLAFKYGKVSV